jgi:hypothetical protein
VATAGFWSCTASLIKTVSTNKILHADTVSTNKILRADTVSTNKKLHVDMVSTNNLKRISERCFFLQMIDINSFERFSVWLITSLIYCVFIIFALMAKLLANLRKFIFSSKLNP